MGLYGTPYKKDGKSYSQGSQWYAFLPKEVGVCYAQLATEGKTKGEIMQKRKLGKSNLEVLPLSYRLNTLKVLARFPLGPDA